MIKPKCPNCGTNDITKKSASLYIILGIISIIGSVLLGILVPLLFIIVFFGIFQLIRGIIMLIFSIEPKYKCENCGHIFKEKDISN